MIAATESARDDRQRASVRGGFDIPRDAATRRTLAREYTAQKLSR